MKCNYCRHREQIKLWKNVRQYGLKTVSRPVRNGFAYRCTLRKELPNEFRGKTRPRWCPLLQKQKNKG